MGKSKKKEIKDPLTAEREYLIFLRKRLDSENFKANESEEEYQKTVAKYDKCKLKIRMMEQDLIKYGKGKK